MMKIDILTLFPKMFAGPFDESIIKRAQDKKLVQVQIHDLRKWGQDARKTVDDRPYGGGVGMIIRVDVVARAISNFQFPISNKNKRKIVLLDAGGEPFVQKKAVELSKLEHLILIAGHYEGIDHRVHEHLVDEVISIGDYVLTGGEIPAMVIVDTVVRLLPGVIKKESLLEESFSQASSFQLPTSNIEHPQYTRPEDFRGWKVPEVLLKGNHKEIEKWRIEKSLVRTKARRPDLVK